MTRRGSQADLDTSWRWLDGQPPDLEALLLGHLYAGARVVAPAGPASGRLVALGRLALALAWGELGGELGGADLDGLDEACSSWPDERFDALRAQRLAPDLLYARLTQARALLAKSERVACATRSLLAALGAGPWAPVAWDRARLRAVAPGAHRWPQAKAAYGAHRDTWYANPACQLNLWVPLHDVERLDCFGFYPDCFGRFIPNDSGCFNYDEFARQVGFQGSPKVSAPVFPTPDREALSSLGSPERFTLGRAQVLMFSAAHLHQTLPHDLASTRFSLDLRVVWRPHQRAGLGAPDLDNASTGDASRDYQEMTRG